MARTNNKMSLKALLIVACWIELVAEIWKQRNNKIFEDKLCDTQTVANSILFRVACRCNKKSLVLLVKC